MTPKNALATDYDSVELRVGRLHKIRRAEAEAGTTSAADPAARPGVTNVAEFLGGVSILF